MSGAIWSHAGWFFFWIVPLCGFSWLAFYLISLPMRRQERAALFLDLIETGLKRGHSVEHTVVSIARSRDRTLGVRFHALAVHLESGMPLSEALRRVPRLLPPQMTAMLRVGEETGDVPRILPACRTLLKDGTSQVQSSYSYLMLLAFVLFPAVPVLFWFISVSVLPAMREILADLGEAAIPFPDFGFIAWAAKAQLVLAALFYVAAVFYVGGPRFLAWIEAGFPIRIADAIFYRLPWRRKRMQRDFTAMLALLLDAGTPEERAVQLAAESAANSVFFRRAQRVTRELRSGMPLTEAIQHLDDSREFRWRLANAFHSDKRFFATLKGWLESLDAKAYQQEQAVAQSITTALVFWNGAVAGLFAVSVLHVIVSVIQAGVLW